MQKNLQSLDGHIITNSTGLLPKSVEIPGKQYRITLQNTNQNKMKYVNESNLILLNSKCCYANHLNYTFECNQLHTKIGQNLYRTNSENQKANQQIKSSSTGSPRGAVQRAVISNAVKKQLNDLSSIINVSEHKSTKPKKMSTSQEIIKLDLFQFDHENADQSEPKKEAESDKNNSVRFGRRTSALRDALDNLDLGDNESSDIKTADSDEEDIFDLLNEDDD